MIKVLLTGGGGAGNEALFQLLGNSYMLHFGDADISAIDPAIPEDRRHKLPWASAPEFFDEINQLCKRLRIDLLIPGVDEELLVLASNAEKLLPTRLLLPDAEYVEIMLDKLHMVRALSEKQILVPLSQTLDCDIRGIEFPCIAKPRSGRGSRDVRLLNSPIEATNLKSSLGFFANKMLLQERIDGYEYTVQMISNAAGGLAAIVPVKVHVKSGITLRAETDADSRVIAACRAIHRAIPAKGVYNIQLMLTPDGRVFPFEINPRISTTLCLVVAAGIDPIAIYLEEVQRKELLSFTKGVQLRRYWKNFFL